MCETVEYKTLQLLEATDSSDGLIEALLCVHLAYEELQYRLDYFQSINTVWPLCSERILDIRAQNPDHFMFKEHAFVRHITIFRLVSPLPVFTTEGTIGLPSVRPSVSQLVS